MKAQYGVHINLGVASRGDRACYRLFSTLLAAEAYVLKEQYSDTAVIVEIKPVAFVERTTSITRC
jgi:hypothetical protein